MGGSTSKLVDHQGAILEKEATTTRIEKTNEEITTDYAKEKSSSDAIISRSRSWFSDDLVIDILKRVDDGSCIVRLRCLNKSWCRMLSHPSFVHSFLCFNPRPKDPRRQIIVVRARLHRLRWRPTVVNGRPCRSYCDPIFRYNFDYKLNDDDDDDINERGMTYSLLSYDTLSEQRVLEDNEGHLLQIARDPPPPPEVVVNIDPNNSVIVGSCDGILCLGSRNNGLEAASDLILWNPTTGEAKSLPSIPSIPSPPPHLDRFRPPPPAPIIDEYFGFGFDPNTSDYRIVAIFTLSFLYSSRARAHSVDQNKYHDQFNYSPKFPWICTWVYSLRDDKWRKFRISNNMVPNHSPLPFAAGNYKPLISNNNNITSWYHSCGMCKKCYIMSFDMSKHAFELETFEMHQELSALCLHMHPFAMALMLKSNSILAVCDIYDWFNGSFCQYYEVWGILDYKKMVNKNPSSSSSGHWLKLFSFDGDLMRPLVSSIATYMSRLPGIWKDGYYFSLGDDGQLNLFDPATKRLKQLQVGHENNDWPIFGIVAYTPSTISLSGFKRDDGMSFLNWFIF